MNCEAVRQILAQSLNLLQHNYCKRRYRFGIFDFEAFLALTQLPIQEHIIYTPVILLPEEAEI